VDKVEAKAVLQDQMNKLRILSYSEIRKLAESEKTETLEIAAKSGKRYQLEIQAFWDDKREKNIRVMVSIDDGGWLAFFPLSSDCIIAPDGSFVGE
jgi:hypothetical protein